MDLGAGFGPLQVLAYFTLGLCAAAYGTLIGAGGGFIIVPMLLILFGFGAQDAAGTSLAVVFVNAISSTYLFSRQGRIDFRTGSLLAVATIPGAIMGAYIASSLDPRTFRWIFGALMAAVAIFILVRPPNASRTVPPGTVTQLPWRVYRRFADAGGQVFEYTYNPVGALAFCFVIGFLSSMLGIGGGIMLTPALILVFGVPAHVATATAQVALLVSSGFGSLSHLSLGHVQFLPALPMAAGVLAGSQVGAAISKRLNAKILVRVLAIGMLLVGLRLAIG